MCPDATIDTEEMEVDLARECEAEQYVWNNEKRRSEKVIKRVKGYARFKAVVTDGKGGRATGTKSENAANFPDFCEKAETGAIGRALAGLGYGTQFAPELNEGQRLVDSPVSRAGSDSDGSSTDASNSTAQPTDASSAPPDESHEAEPVVVEGVQPINATQLKALQEIYRRLGQSLPEGIRAWDYVQAKGIYEELRKQLKDIEAKRAHNREHVS